MLFVAGKTEHPQQKSDNPCPKILCQPGHIGQHVATSGGDIVIKYFWCFPRPKCACADQITSIPLPWMLRAVSVRPGQCQTGPDSSSRLVISGNTSFLLAQAINSAIQGQMSPQVGGSKCGCLRCLLHTIQWVLNLKYEPMREQGLSNLFNLLKGNSCLTPLRVEQTSKWQCQNSGYFVFTAILQIYASKSQVSGGKVVTLSHVSLRSHTSCLRRKALK